MDIDTIVCADALDFLRGLPDGCVDIVVTSPPYNLQWKSRNSFGILTGTRWIKQFRNGYPNADDHMPEDEYQSWIKTIVAECLRVSKGLVWINHKTRYRDGFGIHPLHFLTFPLWSEVVWDQRQSRTLNARKFAPSHEYFFGFGRPHFWDDSFNTYFTVWSVYPGASPEHPAPFPAAVIRPLIEASCPLDGVVADPFMGSGTTALVAKMLGRHFIGCDNAPEYVALAQRRLAAPYTLPLPLDAAPPAVAVQGRLWEE